MIRKASYTEVLAQKDLIRAYAEECSLPEIGQVNPHAAIYAAMEASGLNQWFVAENDKIVGFASVLIPILPHYSLRVATVESLYGKHGLELIGAVRDYAKAQGCVAVLYSAPYGGRLEKLLDAKKNCRRSNTVFVEKL